MARRPLSDRGVAARPLTAVAVDKLKARPGRYEVPDAGQRGLLVAVFPSGKKSFIVRYRFGGIKRKLTLGGVSLAAARKAAAAALYDVHEGRDPALAKKATKAKASETAADTVQTLCENYLKREGVKLRTVEDRKRDLERLVYPVIGHEPVAALRRSQVVRMLDGIEDKCGARTADLQLAYLSRVFNWHASRSDEFRSPLVRGMSRLNTKDRARSRTLNDDEIKKLWTATEPTGKAAQPFHALIRFLLLTGCRRNEATLLPWSEVNGTDWELPAARNKTKVDLVRPLSKAARAIVAAQPRIADGPLVFSFDGRRPISPSRAKRAFDKACGVTGWVLHDLRRSFRTLASRAGVNADYAERALGHVIGGIRGTYDKHEYYREKQDAFEAVATLVERIVNPPANVVTPLRRRR
jgi:integrase